MRQTVAKRLRATALDEMIGDGVPKRDLVMGRHSVVNSPDSIRAFYLKLKKAWVNLWRGDVAPQPVRQRKASGFHRPADLGAKPALIQSPLKQLRALFPSTKTPTGGVEVPWIVSLANAAARRGDGAEVQALARMYI